MKGSSFEHLVRIIATLRDPETGCPWDRAQDHRSLRPYLLEETYEALDAMENGDNDALAEELGDVLLQVLLHSQIASERGAFSIDDVLRILSDKLIRRHPHVFGDASREDRDIHEHWHRIKRAEGKRPEPSLSILLDARKAVSKPGAARSATWGDDGCFTDEEQAGRKLLAIVEEVWFEGHDPELALRAALKRLAEYKGDACG